MKKAKYKSPTFTVLIEQDEDGLLCGYRPIAKKLLYAGQNTYRTLRKDAGSH